MTRIAALLIALGITAAAAPAALFAQGRSAADLRPAAIPAQLSASERDNYRAVFAALRGQDWAGAAGRLDGMREGPLHDLARAMLYTMPGSPRVELQPLTELLERAPHLPQAGDLARLATLRGATALPVLPQAQRLAGQAGQPRRARPRPIRGDRVADTLEPLIQQLIVADRPYEAEALLAERSADLSDEARTAFQQRIAWSHYLTGNDAAARDMAGRARRGPTEWALHADWVAGLAAWRQGECDAAAAHFHEVGSRSGDAELMAAGQYWAARADMMCGRPERVQARLRTAARMTETFYGLLAQSALGIRQPPVADAESFTRADWRALADERNVRAALALHEIGESQLAADLLRHQARIGRPSEHQALVHLAARLNLPSLQMWLAHNAPRGVDLSPLARYPAPDWNPQRGWRVDQALVYAHALQESGFRPEAVSPAGARGLMQVMPGTAGDIARRQGRSVAPAELNDPLLNVEFGQTYMEYLRDFHATQGLLPKVIAAYNAGPAPIAEWNSRGRDMGDPLLYIESIPYWETRGYVPIVLRNYWIYEQARADQSASRRALAQGMWPRFPGLSGPTAVRIDPPRRDTAMGQR
jgi:soluble lytic murein transglycosylase